MSSTESSLILSLLLSGLAVVLGILSGYLLRIVQKYDDRKDELYLNFLPSLSYAIYSFINAREMLLTDSQLPIFVEKMKNINLKLDEQLSSGDLLFLKEDLRHKVIKFKEGLDNLQNKLEEVEASESVTKSLINAFRHDRKFLLRDTDPSALIREAEEIQQLIEHEVKGYKSPLYVVIVIFLLFTIAAIIKLLES